MSSTTQLSKNTVLVQGKRPILFQVKLEPKNRRSNNKVTQFGDTWNVLREASDVKFDADRGPWLCLQSLCGKSIRWVRKNKDDEFNVYKVPGSDLKSQEEVSDDTSEAL